MSARDKERYYWLKLDRGFFKRHDITVIEDMPNGKDYVLFYLKLMLESVDHEGALRFSDTIPYNEEMLSSVTHTNVDIVRSALKVLETLGMVEVFDDKTLFMAEVAKLLDSETYAARRKREAKNDDGGNFPPLRGNFPLIAGNVAQEKEIEKEIEKESDKEKERKKKKADAFSEFADGDADLLSVLRDFEKMRKSIGKPLGDRAKAMLLFKLQRDFQRDQWIPVLEQSIFHSWQGIFPVHEDDTKAKPITKEEESNRNAKALEQIRRIQAKMNGDTE